MRLNKFLIFAVSSLSFFMFSCHVSNSADHWRIAYQNDKSGKTISGSKKELINAIRLGCSIKIGWGAKGESHTIEHLSDPIWIAVIDGEEVLAHLDPQVLSSIDWEEGTGSYKDTSKLSQEWRVVINTDGTFDAIWYDIRADTLIQRRPQQHRLTWFVKDCDVNNSAAPYYGN